MNLREVEKALDGLGFNTVAGLMELGQAATRSDRLDAAYVYPDNESSPGSTMFGSGVHDQLITVRFGVLIRVSTATARRDDALDRLQERRDAVRDRLMGWTHPQATGPTDYLGGRLLTVGGGAANWVSLFRTEEAVRKAL